jgi:hypothetical protein
MPFPCRIVGLVFIGLGRNRKRQQMTQNMKTTKLNYLAAVGLALCLVHSVSAQDSHWNGTPGNNLWNVATNWTPVGVPPPGNPTTTYQGNVWLDPANGDSVITIPAGDVEAPGVGNSSEVFNTMFGPEFGCTLNIYGTLSWDWTMAPYQPDPTPGLRSHINLYDNAYVHTSGASLNLGSGWWTVCEGPYVTMNLYSNANYSSLGGAGLWSGGHINIYDNATFLINGYVNLNNGQANNDGTTDFVLGGGTLMLPEGFKNTTVTNWITRGILRAYGKGYDTNDLAISDNGTNTIVTPVPLGGALQRVYFQPLLQTTVNVSDFQQATLVGDYPSVSGVLLSSSEPGLSPGSFPQPAYTSSNPSVATVDANGLVTAVGIGSATLTAKVGAFNSTNSVTITVTPVVPGLAHRYSFATDASDSVGGADGTPNGDVNFTGGQLVFNGTQGSSVILPAGILSGLNEVTIEAWATFPSINGGGATLFAFGNANGANAADYISLTPHSSDLTPNTRANFGQGPGSSGERNAVAGGVLDNQTNLHIVAVFYPDAGSESLYINGVRVANNSMFNIMIDPVASQTPAFNGGSILAYTLGGDPFNYLGSSLYSADAGLLASIDEFRIYTNALTAAQIAADHALGPNQFIGTSTATVILSASRSGGNLIIKWPTTSALVNLVSSPALGAGAVWTPVNGTLTTDGSGHYQMTIPASGSAQFFRLQQ